MQGDRPDIAIVGGGLSGGLLALALARLRPELRLLVLDSGATFGGNHVWSWFASDVPADLVWLADELGPAEWGSYEVRFPRLVRQLSTPYRSLASEKLNAALRRALPASSLCTGVVARRLEPAAIILADGSTIEAGAVIDARGPERFPGLSGGWQKFLGRMLRLDRPHGIAHPIVMDARVAQRDGYRFVYVLPFSRDTLFVEDTYYSDTPLLDRAISGERLDAYVKLHRWHVAEVLREEAGVLPVVAQGRFDEIWPADDGGPARAGLRAGLFHPLTSYSVPSAMRFAGHVAGLRDLSGEALAAQARAYSAAHWRSGAYYRLLARMLFGAASPKKRYKVLERFYRLDQGLVERFYAGQSSGADKLRVLAGRPPVPLMRAAASLIGRGFPLAPLDRLETAA